PTQETTCKKPPRPMNSFMIYRSIRDKEIRIENPSITTGELSKQICEMWRKEPQEVRSTFMKMAEEAKQQHMESYPGYKY
ncbi:high mobility group box protein, partial [Gigaspora rosea]